MFVSRGGSPAVPRLKLLNSTGALTHPPQRPGSDSDLIGHSVNLRMAPAQPYWPLLLTLLGSQFHKRHISRYTLIGVGHFRWPKWATAHGQTQPEVVKGIRFV